MHSSQGTAQAIGMCNIYHRITDAFRSGSAFMATSAAAACVLLFAACSILWLPAATNVRFVLFCVPVLVGLVLILYTKARATADVVMTLSAIEALRDRGWGPLYYVLFRRGIRSRAVLRDPAVVLIAGAILAWEGYIKEGKHLQELSTKLRPSLCSIRLFRDTSVSGAEVVVLTEGLRELVQASALARMGFSTGGRRVIFVVGGAVFLLSVFAQLLRLFLGAH